MLSFKQYLTEYSQRIGDIKFEFTKHFWDRFSQRSEISREELNTMLQAIERKAQYFDHNGKYLFFSKSISQGIVAAWNAKKKVMNVITFFPRGQHHTNPETQEVILESITYSIIYVD